jgi:uncharacterized membrane protein
VTPCDDDLEGLERSICRVLRAGVLGSSVCLSAGLLLTLMGQGADVARMLLWVGLVVLLVTPGARVVVSVAEYVKKRDWAFVALTLSVLLALTGSVIAAFWR